MAEKGEELAGALAASVTSISLAYHLALEGRVIIKSYIGDRRPLQTRPKGFMGRGGGGDAEVVLMDG